jgi:hypothetical protein
MTQKILVIISIILFFPSFISAQTEENSDIIHTELKSDNPTLCPEKKAEFIGGINEFRIFFAENLNFSDSITVRVIAERPRRGNRRNSRNNTLQEIQALNLTITSTILIFISPQSGLRAIDSESVFKRRFDMSVEGDALVSFVVEIDGGISNVEIVKKELRRPYIIYQLNTIREKMQTSLETEIVKVILRSADKWIPAEMNCEKVRVNVIIPINWRYIFPAQNV